MPIPPYTLMKFRRSYLKFTILKYIFQPSPLCRMALSHKGIAKEALERNELLRATWQGVHGDIPKEYIIWLDEASVDDRTNQRHAGWASMGWACVWWSAFIHGQHYSILPALTCDGIISLDIFEGFVNKEKFISFLEDLVCPFLIVMAFVLILSRLRRSHPTLDHAVEFFIVLHVFLPESAGIRSIPVDSGNSAEWKF